MSYVTVNDHRAMALDSRRNDAYFRALQRAVSADNVVMDLGAGIGVHGLMAAGLGARTVYFVEPENVVHAVVPAYRSRFPEGTLRVVQDLVEHARIEERVDVIVSVMTGNFLLSEDLLPSLFHARDRFLKPGGRLVPDAARMMAAPVHAPDLHAELVASWSGVQHGVDLSPARRCAANLVHHTRSDFEGCVRLAAPRVLQDLDFHRAAHASCNAEATFVPDRDGVCHGLLGWFDMRLDDEWFSTGPDGGTRSHWALAYLPLDPPLDVRAGEPLSVRVVRPEFGDWTWRAASGRESRQHSTFFGLPLSAELVKKADDNFRPRLSRPGRLVRYVLDSFEEGMTVEAIRKAACAEFHQVPRYVVEQMVRHLAARFG